jgi:hypothetical protein
LNFDLFALRFNPFFSDFTYFFSLLVDSFYFSLDVETTFVIVKFMIMSGQVSVCMPKWMSKILYEPYIMQKWSNKIPTVFVDSPNLTASYYREYLDFRIILRYSSFKGKTVLLQKGKNLIWVKSIKLYDNQFDNIEFKFQKIMIYSRRIENDYTSLIDKVKLVKPLQVSGTDLKTFSILDCNGIEIVYTN